jgi:uncharacterized protein (TIGR03437 family)
VIGVKAYPGGATNGSWSGLFFTAGLRYDTSPARITSVTGAVNATSSGSVWSRRTHQSDGTFDASPLIAYSLTPDGSGVFPRAGGHLNIAASGDAFSTSGVDVVSSTSYELYFGVRMPPQSGQGVFLHPQGVYNSGSYAPAGYPLSPGGFITMFGNFPVQTAVAPIPFPQSLGGVQVSVNGITAPVYAVSATQISAVVPYAATGPTAAVQITVNGTTKSNAVTVPLAATAPGVFSITRNGLEDGAILRQNYSVVTQSNPATPGEFIQIFLTGLGAVNPAVPDGTAAAASPLATVTGPVNVYLGGVLATNVQFKGLSPGLASLYQINVQVPISLGPGPQPLAIQTPEGFTDLVNVWVASQ